MLKTLLLTTALLVPSLTFAGSKMPVTDYTLSLAYKALEENIDLPKDIAKECNEQAPFLSDKTLLWYASDAEDLFIANAATFLCPFYFKDKITFTEKDGLMTIIISEEGSKPFTFTLRQYDKKEDTWIIRDAGGKLLMNSEDEWIRSLVMLQHVRIGLIKDFMVD